MQRIQLLLGSNLGNRAEIMARARGLISDEIGEIVGGSGEVETAPWGYSSANMYLNEVLVVDTDLEPLALLDATQSIERALGRKGRESRDEAYSDRPIDIDILYYGDEVIRTERLIVPHPEIENRQFVLDLLARTEIF